MLKDNKCFKLNDYGSLNPWVQNWKRQVRFYPVQITRKANKQTKTHLIDDVQYP